MRKIEHLGIAVRDLEASNALYTALLGAPPYKEEAVESEHVLTSFFRVGETKIELLQATDPNSAIHKFIENAVRASTTSPLTWRTFMPKSNG